jgi:hypothetical protein
MMIIVASLAPLCRAVLALLMPAWADYSSERGHAIGLLSTGVGALGGALLTGEDAAASILLTSAIVAGIINAREENHYSGPQRPSEMVREWADAPLLLRALLRFFQLPLVVGIKIPATLLIMMREFLPRWLRVVAGGPSSAWLAWWALAAAEGAGSVRHPWSLGGALLLGLGLSITIASSEQARLTLRCMLPAVVGFAIGWIAIGTAGAALGLSIGVGLAAETFVKARMPEPPG